MDASIGTFLDEMWMLSEAVLITMLKYEVAFRMKQVVLEYTVREGFKSLQSIRRICKDDIELLTADREEVKHIVANHRYIPEPQPICFGLDE